MSDLSDFIIQKTTASGRHALAEGVDLVFMKVSAVPDVSLRELQQLIGTHEGVFAPVDVFDGAEHGYIELGGWLGSQELALRFMGLGVSLGLFQLLSPRMVLGENVDSEMELKMAGMGMVTIQALKSRENADS